MVRVETIAISRLFPWALGFVLIVAGAARAERPPVKTYTTADGLVSNLISRIVRDSHGYLWFCTEGGLARFDGHSFNNYTTDQGLPDDEVNDLLETRSGTYWLATGKGLCRFNPKGAPLTEVQAGRASEPMFVVYHPGPYRRASSVKTLYEDAAGRIWCGTWQGLYLLEQKDDQVKLQYVDIGMPAAEPSTHVVRNILQDRRGAIWVTSDSGLYRLLPDGRAERFTNAHGLSSQRLLGLLEDREGRLWVGDRLGGLCLLLPEPAPNGSIVARRYSIKDGLSCVEIASLFESSDRRLWVGADCGLSEFLPEPDRTGRRIRSYLGDKVLADSRVWALAEDLHGNLWVGSASGAVKVIRSGFTTYTEADGLGSRAVISIFESRSGQLCVQTRSHHENVVSWFDGQRFIPIRKSTAPGFDPSLSLSVSLQDREGEWWMDVPSGLARFPKTNHVEELTRLRAKSLYTEVDGLPGTGFPLREDQRGDMWIVAFESQRRLTRWERRTGRFQIYSAADGLPSSDVVSFASCEDRAGNLWIGLEETGLVRYENGRFKHFTHDDGVPEGVIRDLVLDSKGRLWVASSQGGLGRIDDPTAAHPQLFTYSVTDGLSSNKVWCLVEDQWGRIYAGTNLGLDRLDPETGRVRHFTTSDGLAHDAIRDSFRSRDGALWFGTGSGISRLIPEPDTPQSPPPILITGLLIAGEDHRVSALGESEIGSLHLRTNQNNIRIDFTGVSFGGGETLRYQYRLEGADVDWSEPSDKRSINYANLSPGSYRFLVRAVSGEGRTSESPAAVSFTILPPIWKRWWFATLAVTLVGLLIYAAYRHRVARVIELERIRTRIASDLHDDIGSNLSLIAMVSEAAQRQVPVGDRQMGRWLSMVSDTSREMVDAMSDIVWAVNPNKDWLRDLLQRMRRVADDIFTARHIEFRFSVLDEERDVKLGADIRREVFMIFKEGVNNIVRHSQCTEVELEFRVKEHRLQLRLADNGRGFNLADASDGNGMVSMRRRAEKLGGQLEVISSYRKGTTVILRAPLYHRRRL
jgi:ligand-binding sensor domain-containing protein/two-component sensor histidine kinase